MAFSGIAQDLNIKETLEYINKKINENKASCDKYTRYEWSVSDDGKLTVSAYWNEELNSTQQVYLKILDPSNIKINMDNVFQTEYFFTIQIFCKNNRNDVLKKYNRYLSSASIFLRVKPDDQVANQVTNAIKYLITMASKKSEYKEEIKDPFDYN